jgi:hypothetical protein
MKRLAIIKRLVMVTMTMGCCACEVTGPVIVYGENGQTLRGDFTATLIGGTFSVTDRKLTCSGTYNSWDPSTTISMAVKCSDGRSGTVTAKRNPDHRFGTGTVQMDDGSRATLVFGFDAAYTPP